MKKTILLLATVISISTAFAQYNGNHTMVVAASNKSFGYDKGTYFFSAKDKDIQIAQINKDYDKKVLAVKMKLFIKRSQKDKMISDLQAQRNKEISAVNAKFYDRKNMFNQQASKFDGRDKKHNW